MSAQPNPLDAVQFGPNDVASPTPVDVSPDAVAGPRPDVAGGLQPDEVPNTQGDNPTAAAVPPKPSFWKNILHGALAGLENGGGVGAAIGVVDPKLMIDAKARKLQLANDKLQFADLQAAAQKLDNSQKKWIVDHMPETQRLEYAKVYAPIMQEALRQNVPLTIIPPDPTGGLEVSHMKQVASANNGVVPHEIHIPLPDGSTAVFNTDNMGQNRELLKNVNIMAILNGQSSLANPLTQQQFNKLPKAAQRTLLDNAASLFAPSAKNFNDQAQQIQKYKGWIATANRLGMTDVSQQLQKAMGMLQNQNFPLQLRAQSGISDGKPATAILTQNGWVTADASHTPLPHFRLLTDEEKAMARGKGYGMWKVEQVVDPVTQQAGYEWAWQAVGNGAAPLAEGTKLMAKGQQLSDIKLGAQNMRQDVSRLQNPFTAEQIAGLTMALRATDPTVMQQILDAKVGVQNLSSDQMQYVTDLLNLHERAMALRSVAGIGNQSSEAIRAAIIAMLPQVKDTPELMLKKLDRFDQQVAVLSRIPKVKGAPAPGSDTGNGKGQSNGLITVTDPNGKPHHFKDQASADRFKKLAGIK